ncbi:MAG TPA: hypothetical protein H9717_01060 [Candidatus Eisenbergiella merdipullorum]|uniref:Uncharacterized protein n=1 Tax=Candidatus Eisenbergiella merdipullorum TaxID=2838553 RepID=A0A9D2I2T1_9FIRM|nr:hypothetical protein [Candidatus Eisenbergiella merdipullorum]
MKNITRFCVVTLVLSMLLAFVVFTLFAGGILVLDTSSRIFDLLIAFSCILLSALLLGSLIEGSGRLRSLSCCVSLSAAGGGCLAITAFLTSLSTTFSGIIFSIGIALCFFFLALFAGGIFCLLHGLLAQEDGCCGTGRNPAASRSHGSSSGNFSSGNLSSGSLSSGSSRPSFRRGYEEREAQEDGYYSRRPPL